jgi:hypothetical protein
MWICLAHSQSQVLHYQTIQSFMPVRRLAGTRSSFLYASKKFYVFSDRLTGYANSEIVGRNCRFLQAPYGEQVIKGQIRKFSDSFVAFQIKQCVASGIECQFSIIKYVHFLYFYSFISSNLSLSVTAKMATRLLISLP